MKDGPDGFVDRLQREIFEETERERGPRASARRWDPLYKGAMPAADGFMKKWAGN